VLKDGRTVARNLPAPETPTAEVIRLMTGRSIEYVFPQRGPAPDGDVLLEVDGLARRGEFADVSFTVRAGEVVGLAGLVGSGRSEILETVYGARRPAAGTVRVRGRALRSGSVPAAVRAGMGLAPEERKSQGLLLAEPVYRNVSLPALSRFSRAGFMRGGAELAAAAAVTAQLDVRPADPTRPARTLSGGNQQKVVLARWLLEECSVLLLDEPTRGVDVGARSEIYALVRRLAQRGVAVVLVSSEVPEVLGLADRVLVVREGRVVREAPAAELDEGDAGVGELADQVVDLRAGADINTAGGLVQQQHLARPQQPTGQHDLLLVAARERADDAIGCIGAHVDRPGCLVSGATLRLTRLCTSAAVRSALLRVTASSKTSQGRRPKSASRERSSMRSAAGFT